MPRWVQLPPCCRHTMPAVTATTDTRCSPEHLVISGSHSIADRLTGFLSPKQQAIVVQRVLAFLLWRPERQLR